MEKEYYDEKNTDRELREIKLEVKAERHWLLSTVVELFALLAKKLKRPKHECDN